jgi:uncharacterized membrane protein
VAAGVEPAKGNWSADRVAGLALLVLAGLVAWEIRVLPLGTLRNPGPGYYPLALAILVGALGLLVAWRGAAAVTLRQIEWPELRHAVLILASGVFAALALERLGYRLTILILVLFLLGVVERRKPLAVALVAAVLSFGTHYLFDTLLRVPLPAGVIGF